MSRRFVPWILAGAIAVGVPLGAAVVALLPPPSRSPVDQVVSEVGLPQSTAEGSAVGGASVAAFAAERAVGGPALVLDADLLAATPIGALPRIAPDGRRPLEAYSRSRPSADGPRIGFLLVEIGLDRKASIAALSHPAPVTLVVSPYADRAVEWHRAARWNGRETLLQLPIRPAEFPRDDMGPLALHRDGIEVSRLERVLERGLGYVGVAAEAGVFRAEPTAFEPIASALAARGLGLVELAADHLGAVAAKVALPYVSAGLPIDDEPSVDAIDSALSALEARAVSTGYAVGYGRPMPITIERLGRWAEGLAGRGIALVGIADILLRQERAGRRGA